MLGYLDKYCPKTSHLDYVEQFFIVNDITCGTQTESKGKAILLCLIWEKMYWILEDLCARQKSSEKSHEKIKHLLLKHLKLKQQLVAKIYHVYYNPKQDMAKFCSNFFVHFKNFSSTCKFGIFLKAFKDKFVCVLDIENIQKNLLSKDMSLEKYLLSSL